MSSQNKNTFCYRYLTRRSGIEPKTIDVLVTNGFGSVHALLAMDLELDLERVPNITLGQRSLVRSALKDIKHIHNDMDFKEEELLLETRQLLEESLRDDNKPMSPKKGKAAEVTKQSPSPRKRKTKDEEEEVIASNDKKQVTNGSGEKKNQAKRRNSPKDKSQVSNGSEPNEPNTSIKFGLRDRSKIKKKSSFEEEMTEEMTNASGDHEMTEKCQICGDTSKLNDLSNGFICQPCYRFFTYYQDADHNSDSLKCVNGTNDCKISKKTRTQCPACRLSKCSQVIEEIILPEDNSVYSDDNRAEPLIPLSPISIPRQLTNLKDLAKEAVKVVNKATPKSGLKKKLICQVCGDKALGVNYGVASCNGCAIFFHRVTNKERLIGPCRNTGDCLITPVTRADCKYCRFQGCLSAGMSLKGKSGQNADESEQSAEAFDYASVHCGRTPETP